MIAQAAAIEDGGMTLVTRTGVLSWLQGQLSRDASDGDVTLTKLLGQLWTSCGRGKIETWRGGLVSCDV